MKAMAGRKRKRVSRTNRRAIRLRSKQNLGQIFGTSFLA
jgi:hypothetical protein